MTREQRKPAPGMGGAPARPGLVAGVELTHPDRILWGGQGLTKQGLAEFYAGIADLILPHVVRRPLSLVRCPSGTGKACFFQKHAWAGLHKAIREIDVPGDDRKMLMIEDVAGLVALVQAGVLEIHPWGTSLGTLKRPDRLIFDLDPGEGADWADVVAAAREVRTRLADEGLESFVKTSGGKGLHVVVPVRPEAGWAEARAFTERIARAMAADNPRRYLATMAKAARAGRIFVDYLRNGQGATAVAPYSTRARPNAPVSTPLEWGELSEEIRGDRFTVANLASRLARLARDPWAGIGDIRQTVPPASRPRRGE